MSEVFEEQMVVADGAVAMVEAFEIMLALGEADDIERLATGLVETLTEAARTESALTALAYIKEAAARKSITPEILRAARTFLRRVEHHRDLVFVPPFLRRWCNDGSLRGTPPAVSRFREGRGHKALSVARFARP